MRTAGGHDYDRCRAVLGWPLREAMLSYLERERERQTEEYRVALLVWAQRDPHMRKPKPPPPSLPELLKAP